MPWTLDSPTFRAAEGVAKMAAWGFYPHVVLGLKPPRTKEVFPCAPDDPMYAHLLSYWRVLAKADADTAAVYNLPSQNLVALTSSIPDIQGVVYKDGKGSYLIIVANLGPKPAAAELTLNKALLGMDGQYQVSAIDPATGRTYPYGDSSGTIVTPSLPQWGMEGFTLTPSRSSR